MKTTHKTRNYTKKLGKFLLMLVASVAFMLPAFTSSAQCNIKANYKHTVKGNTVYFADASKGAHRVLGWKFGDGTAARRTSKVKHTYAKPGVYNACLIIYGKPNKKTKKRCLDTICKRVVIKDPCAKFKPDFKFRVYKNSAYFAASKHKRATYTWSFGDGSKRAKGQYAKHRYAKPGKYKVCVEIKTRTCKKVICKEVIIKDKCSKLKADFAYRAFTNGAYFRANYVRGAKYTWVFGDGSKRGNGRVTKHMYKKPGTYKVCLQIKTKDCTKLVCKRVVIKDPCAALKVDFKFAQSGNTVKFESRNVGGAYFLWSFGDGKFSKDQNVKHTYAKPGVYKVCLTVWSKDKKCKKVICKVVTIKDPCAALKVDFKFAQSGNTVKFESRNVGGAYFLWSFGDGKFSKDQNVKHTYAKPGVYKVCLTVWSKDKKCKKVICKTVTIKAKVNYSITVYPNPVSSYGKITHNLGLKNTMVIKDSYGTVVHKASNVAKVSKLDATKLKVGVYIVIIEDAAGNRAMQRLIKK